MKLNNAQMNTLQALTFRLEYSNRFVKSTMRDDSNPFVSGPLLYSVQPVAGGSVMLTVTNNTDEARWFDKLMSAIVLVGPRGGVRVYSNDGFPRGMFR